MSSRERVRARVPRCFRARLVFLRLVLRIRARATRLRGRGHILALCDRHSAKSGLDGD